MHIYLEVLTVFVVSILVDVVWGLYIRRATDGKAFAAANFAILIMLFSAINVVSYIGNKWMLIPIVLGNWIGTYSVVRHDHKKQEAQNDLHSNNS